MILKAMKFLGEEYWEKVISLDTSHSYKVRVKEKNMIGDSEKYNNRIQISVQFGVLTPSLRIVHYS